MQTGKVGSCCKNLNDALHSPPNSFFRVEDNGVLERLAYATTNKGSSPASLQAREASNGVLYFTIGYAPT